MWPFILGREGHCVDHLRQFASEPEKPTDAGGGAPQAMVWPADSGQWGGVGKAAQNTSGW